MKLGTKYWCSALVVVGIIATLLGSTAAFAGNPNPGVFPINSRPYGLTYGQWSARWWHYAFKQTTLDICATDTLGSQVIFLAGAGVPVTCTIHAGKAIMFPTFNVEWSDVEARAQEQATPGQSCLLPHQPYGTSNAALQACATAQADHATVPGATLTAKVDGRPLTNLTNYRAVSAPFSFKAVAENPFLSSICPEGCDGHAVADGFWIMLTPLSPGKHIIHFTATVPFPELSFTYTNDTTYKLTVLPER